MRPHLGLGAQPLHGAVEHLDHQLRIDDGILDVAHRDQMDLRLLDLDHRAAGVGWVATASSLSASATANIRSGMLL